MKIARRTWRHSLMLTAIAASIPLHAAPRQAEAVAGTFPGQRQAPMGAPNVLLIMTDDVGFGASSTFGGPIPTPVFDRLAATGLRYNRFHTTGVCSPTRAALLTGRNAHAVGMGVTTEIATPHPGYNGVMPRSAATIAEVLRQNGFSTAMIGKHHDTPDWETGPAGPFDRWPTGLGFDYFYGFVGDEADAWAPALVENNTTIEPPHDDASYILDRDLADHAVSWLRAQHGAAPAKPFFLYLAPGTAHAPHHAPRDWIDRFRGHFDQGWDRVREESFARQKALGVIPADAVLTARPDSIPAWESLGADEKRLYARMMEVYAGALAFCDDQIGRVIEQLRDTGQLDNTIIIYIQGDNGASGEGGLTGTTNNMQFLQGMVDPLPYMVKRIDELGGPMVEGHYPVGWAWAMNTPFRYTKLLASHLGGTRNGMVLSWPGHMRAEGGVRSQFAHVIDIAPTVYEAVGIAPPAQVDGVKQQAIDGHSFLGSLTDPTAPNHHRRQYFEVLANRAVVDGDWMASTTPQSLPWLRNWSTAQPDTFAWELYDIGHDFTQAHDVAARYPSILARMKAVFQEEAKRYHVLPLMASPWARVGGDKRPYPIAGRETLDFYPGPTRYARGSFPDLTGRSWTMSADLVAPEGGAHGMVATLGGRFAGWALLILPNGHPSFVYRNSTLPGDLATIEAPQALSPGPHRLETRFDYEGPGKGGPATIILSVDGKEAGRTRLSHSVPLFFTMEGGSIGRDTGTPIIEDYRMPFVFNGDLTKVTFRFP